jgi:hypothetical protein
MCFCSYRPEQSTTITGVWNSKDSLFQCENTNFCIGLQPAPQALCSEGYKNDTLSPET